MTKLGQMLCRLGRHSWKYLIGVTSQHVVRWCKRCIDPEVAEVFPATKITKPGAVATDRPLRGLDELRTAVAMLRALDRDDPEAVWLLTKYGDQIDMIFSLFRLVIDALAEPSSTDLAGYTERAFDRLDRGR